MQGLKKLSMAVAVAALIVSPLYAVASPAPRALNISKLERRTQRECEDAAEILGKVQSGKLKYPAAWLLLVSVMPREAGLMPPLLKLSGGHLAMAKPLPVSCLTTSWLICSIFRPICGHNIRTCRRTLRLIPSWNSSDYLRTWLGSVK